MENNIESIEIYVLLFSVIIVFLVLSFFIIYFVLLYRRKQLKSKLEKTELKLHYEAELLKTHIEVQEQTMQTIATDLHDNIGQLLSLTTLTLNSIELNGNEKAKQKIDNSLVLVNKSIKELRELAKLMQGEQLIEIGLGNAIQQEVDWLNRAGTYRLELDNQLMDLKIVSPKKDLIILRLLQEIINNIIKHAQATTIVIMADFKEDVLFLTIKEDGVGFDVEAISKQQSGLGLHSIHKRVEMIEGQITIHSIINTGTSIFFEVPYP